MMAGKVYAAMDGRLHVAFEDIRRAVYPALRHRLILTYEAEAEEVTSEKIIDKILATIPVP